MREDADEHQKDGIFCTTGFTKDAIITGISLFQSGTGRTFAREVTQELAAQARYWWAVLRYFSKPILAQMSMECQTASSAGTTIKYQASDADFIL